MIFSREFTEFISGLIWGIKHPLNAKSLWSAAEWNLSKQLGRNGKKLWRNWKGRNNQVKCWYGAGNRSPILDSTRMLKHIVLIHYSTLLLISNCIFHPVFFFKKNLLFTHTQSYSHLKIKEKHKNLNILWMQIFLY